jgi:DNA processing protein
MQKVVDAGGLILSEFKLDQQPQTYTYPQRNRIVAGLADVIFLPEAGKKSGSLITVEYALQMHRPVYGVPNSIFSATSEGINDYIFQGKIHMTKNCKEFLDRYFPQEQANPVFPIPENLSPQEQAVVSCIQDKELCSLSDIMTTNKISAQETMAMLTLLEMKQYIYQETPGVYRAVNN